MTRSTVLTNAGPPVASGKDHTGWKISEQGQPAIVGKGARLTFPFDRSVQVHDGRSQTFNGNGGTTSLVVQRQICTGIASVAAKNEAKRRGGTKYCQCFFSRSCSSLEIFEQFYLGRMARPALDLVVKRAQDTNSDCGGTCYGVLEFQSESDFLGIQLKGPQESSFVEVYFLNWAERFPTVAEFEAWVKKYRITLQKISVAA